MAITKFHASIVERAPEEVANPNQLVDPYAYQSNAPLKPAAPHALSEKHAKSKARVSQYIPKNIKCVARSVGFAIWLDSFDDWFGLSVILRARLDASQRAKLAFMALKSLDPDDAAAVVEAINQ